LNKSPVKAHAVAVKHVCAMHVC